MRRNVKGLLILTTTLLALGATMAGQSLPSFAPPVSYSASGASAAASGDMNGDGRVDVVTANGIATGSHGVSVLLSNGDGTFQAARNFVTNTDPAAVAIGDFNGDGKLDVAAMDRTGNTLSILLGNGDGTLQPATTVALPASPVSIAASDLNADGKVDLVVMLKTATSSFLVGILISNGDGTFSQSSLPSPTGILVVADFNGDGKPDLCICGFVSAVPGHALIKFGNGDGTFVDSPLPFAAFPMDVTVAVAGDFNGDGKMDIYGEFISPPITRAGFVFAPYMAIGNGDGTFTVTYGGLFSRGIGGDNLLVGDFNRDGKLDVAGVFPGPSAGTSVRQPPTVKVLYGAGDGTLSLPVSFAAGPSTAGFTYYGMPLVSGDFDGNGAPDFAWAAGSGINVIRNANGNPPLLSNLSVNSNWVVGGSATVLATVAIGDPAPAGGAVIALSSSDPAAAIFLGGATVTIPAGSTSATFNIATGAVAAAELVTITASWNGVNQITSFHVIPAFTVASVTLNPPSVFGWFGGGTLTTGTVTLSGPAAEGVVINLGSSNPALAFVQSLVAATPNVNIAPGATSVNFGAYVLNNVAADTPVTISASFQGVTKNGTLTVLTGIDAVRLTKAEYIASSNQWKIEATSSSAPANIRVLTKSGTLLGVLAPAGGGTYKGQGVVAGPFTSVVLQSILGGFTTGLVAQK